MVDEVIDIGGRIEGVGKSLRSFGYFLKECLGYRESKEYGYVDLTKEHEGLIEFLERGKWDTKICLMPRYTFKSEIITSGYALWLLVRDPNLRILIYSDGSLKASGFLSTIKNHIEGKAANSRFREWFPDWETGVTDGRWNESQIIIKARKISFKEPSIDTAGIETSKVGMHYDVMFFDDIVSDLNVTTKAQMDKVYECYTKALSLLKPGGKVVIVGTRWHFGDAYGRIMGEGGKDLGIFKRKAIVVNNKGKEEYPFKTIGLTKEFLSKQRDKQGSYFFSCLYQNDPVDDETAVFKYSDFSFYEAVDSKRLFITCTVDPAGEGEDFTGITVVGTDNNLNMYVLDVVNRHLQPNQIVDTIIKLNYKWRFDRFGVETNFFRGLLEKEIKIAIEKESKNKLFKLFSVEVFKATAKRGESKEIRIRSLQPYHERGGLRLKGKNVESLTGEWSQLAYQLMQFPKAPHDDIIDSLAWHVNLIRPGGDAIAGNKPPENSAAGIELKEYEKVMRLNRGVPRAFRKKFELSFN